MNDTDANAYLVQQRQLFGQRVEVVVILGGFTRKLYDKCLALEALNVGQCLAQQIEAELIVDFRADFVHKITGAGTLDFVLCSCSVGLWSLVSGLRSLAFGLGS